MAKQTVEIEFIETEAAYRRALKRLARFFDAPPKTGARGGIDQGLPARSPEEVTS